MRRPCLKKITSAIEIRKGHRPQIFSIEGGGAGELRNSTMNQYCFNVMFVMSFPETTGARCSAFSKQTITVAIVFQTCQGHSQYSSGRLLKNAPYIDQ